MREPEVAMLRMEPSIEGSRTVGTVDEDWTRCFAVKALPELDVRAMDGEGDGGNIGAEEWPWPCLYSSSFRLRVRHTVGVSGKSKPCEVALSLQTCFDVGVSASAVAFDIESSLTDGGVDARDDADVLSGPESGVLLGRGEEPMPSLLGIGDT